MNNNIRYYEVLEDLLNKIDNEDLDVCDKSDTFIMLFDASSDLPYHTALLFSSDVEMDGDNVSICLDPDDVSTIIRNSDSDIIDKSMDNEDYYIMDEANRNSDEVDEVVFSAIGSARDILEDFQQQSQNYCTRFYFYDNITYVANIKASSVIFNDNFDSVRLRNALS